MINFMVLASNADNIAEYFSRNSGGSIDIEHKYSSLQENMSYIMNSNIRIDKFIVVMSESSTMNIKQEMTCLMKLMEGNAFFKVGEILVYAEENNYCSSGINYFKFVMNSLNYTNYNIKLYKDGIKIQSLYRDTLSILPPDEEKTSYNVVYRVRKNEDSKVGYSPRRRQATIYPKTRDGVEEYNKVKHNALKSESGRLVMEPAQKEIQKVDFDLDLFNSNLESIKNVIIFVGPPKSGTSCLCSTTSLQSPNALVLDLSDNLGTYNTFKRMGDEVEYIDNRNLLLGGSYIDEGLKCVHKEYKGSELDLLKYITSIPNRLEFNTLIIDTDLDLLDDLISVLQMKVKKIIYTCESTPSEFEVIQPAISKHNIFTSYLYLNECLDLDNSYERLNAVKLASVVPKCKIIKGENLIPRDLDLSIFL